jgi:hypothetical protein
MDGEEIKDINFEVSNYDDLVARKRSEGGVAEFL